MNRNHYNKPEGKSPLKTVIAILMLLAVLAAWAVTLATEKEPETWDTVHPIPNATISWDQTFYGGGARD